MSTHTRDERAASSSGRDDREWPSVLTLGCREISGVLSGTTEKRRFAEIDIRPAIKDKFRYETISRNPRAGRGLDAHGQAIGADDFRRLSRSALVRRLYRVLLRQR